MRAQPREQLGRHVAVHVGQHHLVGVGEHGFLRRAERAVLVPAGDQRVDLSLRHAGLERARDVLLVAGPAAVDDRQPEPDQLLVALLHPAAEEHLDVELVHDEIDKIGRLPEYLDECRFAGEPVEHVPGRLEALRQPVAGSAREQRVDHGRLQEGSDATLSPRQIVAVAPDELSGGDRVASDPSQRLGTLNQSGIPPGQTSPHIWLPPSTTSTSPVMNLPVCATPM